MTNAWEVTVDDVKTVLDQHEIPLSDHQVEALYDELDFDNIEQNVLYYTDFDDQVQSMLDDNHGIRVGRKGDRTTSTALFVGKSPRAASHTLREVMKNY